MSSGAHLREPAATELLGVDCFRGDLSAAADLVLERARSELGGYACFCNTHVLMSAQDDPSLMDALRNAWTVFPDGAPVAWLMPRSTSHPSPHRIGGPDLMPRVFERSASSGVRHGFYGSTPQTLARLTATIAERYPGVEISTAIAPPFGDPDEERVADDLAAIRDAQVDLLWVGLGAPRQELWMMRNDEALGPVLALGVGAAFDFLSGLKTRAPNWMRQSGLEWAHRLGTEPRRLGRRYVVSNTRFLAAVSHDLIARRLRS